MVGERRPLKALRNPIILGSLGAILALLPLIILFSSVSYENTDSFVRSFPILGTFSGSLDDSVSPANLSGSFEGVIGLNGLRYFNGSVSGTIHIHDFNGSRLSGWLTGNMKGTVIIIDPVFLDVIVALILTASLGFLIYASRLDIDVLNRSFAVFLAFLFSSSIGSDLVMYSWSLLRSDISVDKTPYLLGFLLMFLSGFFLFLAIPHLARRQFRDREDAKQFAIFEAWCVRLVILIAIIMFFNGALQLTGANLRYIGLAVFIYGRIALLIGFFVAVALVFYILLGIVNRSFESRVFAQHASFDFERRESKERRVYSLFSKEYSRILAMILAIGAVLLVYAVLAQEKATPEILLALPPLLFIVLSYVAYRITRISLAVGLLDSDKLRDRRHFVKELRLNLLPFLGMVSLILALVAFSIQFVILVTWNMHLGPLRDYWPELDLSQNPFVPLLVIILIESCMFAGLFAFLIPYALHKGRRRIAFGILGFFLSLVIYEVTALLINHVLGPVGLIYFIEIPILGSILNSGIVYAFDKKKDTLLSEIESGETKIADLQKEVARLRSHLEKTALPRKPRRR